MKQALPVFFAAICAVLSLTAFGQQTAQTIHNHQTQPDRCYFDARHQELLQTDPDYAARLDANEQVIQRLIQQGNFRNGSDTLTIPVVVHVLHLGEAVGTGTNISDAQINSAIDNMNERFGGTVGTTTDTKIQFCLAQRDTNCNATTGIVRIDASSHTSGGDNYGSLGITSNNEEGVKALSRWDNTLYCNIWVVSEIDDNGGGAGTQGYAYFPGASAPVDGIVNLYNAFGYDPTGALGYNVKSFTDNNVTLTHEMGHYLDLYHTFEGDNDGVSCPANADCTTDGDRVCDTQAHIRSGSGCPSGANACDVGNLEDIVDNYMNYADETCTVNFTANQITRMRAAACGTRSGLLDGLQCVAPGGGPTGPVAATCSPTHTTTNAFNMGITNITLNTLDVTSGSSQYEGGRQDRTCQQTTTLMTSTMYSIDITVGTPNSQDVEVYIDYNNDGDFLDSGENIFSGTSNTTFSGSFTTPASPTEDVYLRLRVIADWNANTITGPCYTPQYGEVEEYSILFESAGALPVAQFSGTPLTICTGNTVTYTDASTDATGWSWNFGAGATPATANTQGPHVVTYSTVGNKTVTLDVTGPGGADNETKADYVTVVSPVSVGSTGETPESCVGNDGTATVNPAGGSGSFTYLWDAGTGNQTTQTANALAAGTYNVTVTDQTSGCTVSTGVTVTNGCGVPTTQLQTSDCGITVGSMGEYLFADPVAAVQRYQFQITNGGFTTSFYSPLSNPTSRKFAMVFVDSVAFGTTYDVQVRVQVGGVWGAFGPTCQVTTPALTPTTQLVAGDCGTTVASNYELIYYDPVPGATRYRVRLTDGGAIDETVATPPQAPTIQYFTLDDFTSIPYNTSFDVTVAAQMNGVWQAFGPICTVNSPAVVPTTEVIASQCNTSLGLWNYFFYNAVPGATRYRFWVTGGAVNDTAYTFIQNPTATKFALGFVNGTTTSTAYTVRISAYVNGSWQPFGAACTLTTTAKTDGTAMADLPGGNVRLIAFPNPSNGAINVSLAGLEAGDHDIFINVYDMMGKRVFNSVVLSTEGDMIERINPDGSYTNGMYILQVQVDGKLYQEKIVIK